MIWDRFTSLALLGTLALSSSLACRAQEEASAEVVVSVADQKMAVLREGQVVAKFPISTSKFGIGDGGGSYKTPLGHLRVCEKLGGNLPAGTVIKHRQATNEVIAANAPGRDPIVTRILWLEGCESQNANAKNRSIYIHGTPEEKNLGKPASYGCVRMKSNDVIALYNELPVGASVTIIPEKLPRYAKYVPKPAVPTLVAASAKPAPIATGEAQPPAARRPAAEPVLASIPSRKPAEVLKIVASSRPPQHELMKGSILMSGLSEGNSEMPQLRRESVAQR